MKKAISLTIAAVLFIAVLAGCASGIPVYGKDKTEIKAKAGESFTIALDENSTTGYAWAFTIGDESIVSLEKDDYKGPEDKNLVGAGGTRVLTFMALKKGNTEISLTYKPTYSSDVAGEALVYKIMVE